MRGKAVIIVVSIVAGLAIIYGALGFVIPKARRTIAVDENPWVVIAHQGGNGIRPDNTMVAFEHAVEIGVDVLEMDVHKTRDGVLVVIHDDSVDRTTNGTGLVKDLTFDEIRSLDAAYNWPNDEETDSHPYRGQGVQIPSLEEVLRAFPDMPMTIEIKQADPPIVTQFGEMLQKYDREQNTIIASFHSDVMDDFRVQFPEFATSGVEPEIRTFYVMKTLFAGWLYDPPMEAFQVPETSGNLRVITPRFVRAAHRRGINVQVWTINDKESMQRMLDAAVDGIMTDRPDLLLELLGRR